MKLLIYTHSFSPQVGGLETLVMSLAKGLASFASPGDDVACEITVATPTPRGESDDAALRFRVVRQANWSKLVHLIGQADVVHLAGPCFVPMLLALLYRKPVVVEHSVYQAVCPNGLLLDERTRTVCPGHFMAHRYQECFHCNAANVSRKKSAAMLLLTFPRRWMCGKVARNVAPTAHVAKRVALPRTVTIYHGVSQPSALKPTEANQADFPLCFAYVGRLVSEKGLDLLVGAARRLAVAGYTFRLRFIGDGPERPSLEKAVDASGLRPHVTFTGYLRGNELGKALREVGVVVMPSVWEEVAGLSAVEHMMRGRLVIATDIGGLGEIVDGAGLKFALGDVEGLASCMRRVLEEPGLAAQLGEQARKKAQANFREEQMLAQHFAVYRQLAGLPSPSPEHVADGK